MFRIYSFLLAIGFLVFSPVFFLRREKYLSGLRERLGDVPETDLSEGKVVWLHCVSVGEVNAAKPLVDELKIRYAEKQIVVSTTTKTGQELARRIFGDQVSKVFYFPFDFVFSVRKALHRLKPSVVLLMETEIWFNFIREASEFGSKIVIVNGRLSEKSRSRYELIQGFLLELFPYIDLAIMQSERDSSRLISLGMDEGRVRVSGNLKFDRVQSHSDEKLTETFRRRFGISDESSVVLAASTHSPEERMLTESLALLRRDIPGARMIFVPRHPERFGDVIGLVKEAGFKCAVRSREDRESDCHADVVVIDSIGELGALYQLADVVFVGGSLIPHGGQNVLEPALAARAIVTGPSTHNFSAIVEQMISRGAICKLESNDPREYPSILADVFRNLLSDSSKRDSMGRNALAVIEENRGATERTIVELNPIIDR